MRQIFILLSGVNAIAVGAFNVWEPSRETALFALGSVLLFILCVAAYPSNVGDD
jgi:hypothetical protein